MKDEIKITRDLKDMMILALRYALGRKTYVTEQTASFIMNNPQLIDERVKQVMLKDLDKYFSSRNIRYRAYDDCDYRNWLRLYNFLKSLRG